MSVYSDRAYVLFLIENNSIVYFYELHRLIKNSFPDLLYLFDDDNFTLAVKKFLFRLRVQ